MRRLSLVLAAAALVAIGIPNAPAARAIKVPGHGPGPVNYVRAASGIGSSLTTAGKRVTRGLSAQAITAVFTITYGATVPEVAKPAIEAAANVWATQLQSTPDIDVTVNWDNLGGGVLGSGQVSNYITHQDLVTAGVPNADVLTDHNRLYPSAEVNALVGSDVSSVPQEMLLEFNSTPNWYYGTDGAAVGKFDLETVALHEFTHGLGYDGTLTVEGSKGQWSDALPDSIPFSMDSFFRTVANPASFTDTGAYANPDPVVNGPLATALRSGQVIWRGPSTDAHNNPPKMFAPNPFQNGSSIFHVDEATYPLGDNDSLMTPSQGVGEAVHTPGLATYGMFKDIGYPFAALNVPGQVAKPTVSTNGTTITVNWTAPAGDPVEVYQVSDGTTTSIVNGNVLTFTKSSPGTATYQFTVTGRNRAGLGTPSPQSDPISTVPVLNVTSVAFNTPPTEASTPSLCFTVSGGAAPYTASITWGDAAVQNSIPVTVGVNCVPHAFAEDNNGVSVSHTVTVTDNLGASKVGSTNAPILNVVPSVAFVGGAINATAGTEISVTVNVTDPNLNDLETTTISWGDATPNSTASGRSNVAFTHTYTAPGDYTITAKAHDDDADGGVSILAAHISPVATTSTSTSTTEPPTSTSTSTTEAPTSTSTSTTELPTSTSTSTSTSTTEAPTSTSTTEPPTSSTSTSTSTTTPSSTTSTTIDPRAASCNIAGNTASLSVTAPASATLSNVVCNAPTTGFVRGSFSFKVIGVGNGGTATLKGLWPGSGLISQIRSSTGVLSTSVVAAQASDSPIVGSTFTVTDGDANDLDGANNGTITLASVGPFVQAQNSTATTTTIPNTTTTILSRTGSNATSETILALVLVLLGGVFVAISRRRGSNGAHYLR